MTQFESDSKFHAGLNEQRPSAAEELDRRYRQRLCSLVEREINKQFASREDPEDAVQSAFRSFYRGVDEDRFWIDDSGSLWSLLATITRRKILKHAEIHNTKKRSLSQEVHVPDDGLASRDPSPEEVAQATDTLSQLIEGQEQFECDIVRLRLQGCSKAEIALELDCKEGLVRSRLDKIRERLRRIVSDGSGG